MNQDIIDAHEFCNNNRKQLSEDKICGCFSCLKIFDPNKIHEWVDEGKTAICPYCSIDSIIGESSGYPLNRRFLRKMRRYWFKSAN